MEDLQTAVKYILVKGLDEPIINNSLEIIPFYAINSKPLFVLHQQIGEDNYSLVAEAETLPKLVKMSTKELLADFEKNSLVEESRYDKSHERPFSQPLHLTYQLNLFKQDSIKQSYLRLIFFL